MLVAVSRVDSNATLPIQLFELISRMASDDEEKAKFYILMQEILLQGQLHQEVLSANANNLIQKLESTESHLLLVDLLRVGLLKDINCV